MISAKKKIKKFPNWNRRKNFSTLLIHEQKKQIPNYIFHLRARKKESREKPHFSLAFALIFLIPLETN
jgi:hypothetical protein